MSVITLLVRCESKKVSRLMVDWGNFILLRASVSVGMWTESKAFDMSWERTQISFLLVMASSRMCVSCETGCMVD